MVAFKGVSQQYNSEKSSNPTIRKPLAKAPPFFTKIIADYVNQHAKQPPIMLTIGMPDGQPPDEFIEGLKTNTDDLANYKYTSMTFLPALANALTGWLNYRFQGASITSKQLLPLAGSNEGLFTLIQDVLEPGENGTIWMPEPYYPTFKTAQEMGNWQYKSAPLNEGNNYQYDFVGSWQAMPADERAAIKAIVLTYPNNPTGALASRDYLQKTLDFARENNLLVIGDMAYGDIYYPDGDKPISLFELDGADEADIVEFHTFSKNAALPGVRLAYAIFSKPLLTAGDSQKSLYQAMLENRANIHTTGLFSLAQKALAHMLKQPERFSSYLAGKRDEYAQRAKFMLQSLNALGWKVVSKAQSSIPFYLWAKVPATNMTDEAFNQQLIRDTGVAMIPGSYFGDEGAGYLRIAMTQPINVLTQAIQRLKTAGYHYHAE